MERSNPSGRIYDIQSFSIQDGPGIRTTVFLKGCPLRCPWCHSPESQRFEKQLSYISAKCQGVSACRSRCIEGCPQKAIELGEIRRDEIKKQELELIHVRRNDCDSCGKCTEICYPGALSICGTDYTVHDLVTRLLKDRNYYEESGGGVTVSGGEPLCQSDFTTALLKRLKEEKINTALDTTGYVPWEIMEKTVPYTDLYLYDLKNMDNNRHRAVTGVSNEMILSNVRGLARLGAHLQIRIPVIPGFNDSSSNITETARFCAELGRAVEVVQLLPYHNLGLSKYQRIGDESAAEFLKPDDIQIQHLKQLIEAEGVKVSIH